jgi:thymidylate synthase (FAD)
MPHKEKLHPKKHAFPRLFGQLPLTRVKDYSTNLKVELIKYDDPVKMIDGTYDFVKATWSEDGRESEKASYEEKQEALSQMLQGKTLQLGLETVSFIFRITGITRIDTHQIVRQRVGVTFSQHCSGDSFWNHRDILIEPSIYYSKWAKADFLKQALNSKVCYAQMLDSGKVSVQAARSILPHCLETFIFMKVDLATLLFFYQKRIEDGSQTWQMNEVSRQMEREVVKVFPDLQMAFDKAKTRFKFQREASKDRKNTFSTGLYLPKVDDFDYHENDFLYQTTKNEMHYIGDYKQEEIPIQYYFAYMQIDQNLYEEIQFEYDANNRLIDKGHRSNSEVLAQNRKSTQYFISRAGG